jgi:hypothetical protein
MDETDASVSIYLIMAVTLVLILAILGNYYRNANFGTPKSLQIDCKADIKWENYSCMVGNDEYVSCPHPTHIECKGDIPLAMLERYTK